MFASAGRAEAGADETSAVVCKGAFALYATSNDKDKHLIAAFPASRVLLASCCSCFRDLNKTGCITTEECSAQGGSVRNQAFIYRASEERCQDGRRRRQAASTGTAGEHS